MGGNPITYRDPTGLDAFFGGPGGYTQSYTNGTSTQQSLPAMTPVFSGSVGAGGSGNLGPLVKGADSGVAFDSRGHVCGYVNNCTGAGWNALGGGSIGAVISTGVGEVSSGISNTCGVYAGANQITGNSDGVSLGRFLYGPSYGTGAGAIKCETRYYCLGN
ncbi:hypothetical protein GCM10010971_41400 [Silvimonas amylolytica]|uniref:Uncharacterized protein n=1 Tax=Silvimonas amylolytica TaxID=449663 RepID=A0ABQ2PSI3_9NEIS|nr:hypothetical protein GCM10010971_41400 [Silvimonas amylolytica]